MAKNKPTQRDIEIGLDYLVLKIYSNPSKENFNHFEKAINLYGSSGYNVNKYKDMLLELRREYRI